MITVHFYGRLKKVFGEKLQLAVNSPAEAVRLLEANFPGRGFKAFKEGSFFVKRGSKFKSAMTITKEALNAGLGGKDLHFMPAPRGAASSKGIIQVVLGVVLIGAALVLSGGTLAGAAFSIGSFSVSASTLALVGGTLLLGGLAQLLTPKPPSVKEEKSDDTRRMFNGPINVTGQGGCVPVLYGRAIVGSVVGSAGIHVSVVGTDVNPAMSEALKRLAGKSPLFGG